MKTAADVKREVRVIAKIAGDNESAHAAEDALHQEVLSAIANGSALDPKAMAREALETLKLDFSRWYA